MTTSGEITPNSNNVQARNISMQGMSAMTGDLM
jgi:hypothetical protein